MLSVDLTKYVFPEDGFVKGNVPPKVFVGPITVAPAKPGEAGVNARGYPVLIRPAACDMLAPLAVVAAL
jgi:hypothetical protein